MPTPSVPSRVRQPTNRRSAEAGGVTDWQLRHREIVRSSRDTYLPRALAPELAHRVQAVLLGAPSTAVVSHLSAAALWGLEIPLVPADARVHLTVPPGTRIRHRADRRIHVAELPHRFIQRKGTVRLTSPGRTWLDLAGMVPTPSLLAMTDQMLARQYPPAALRRLLEAATGVRGVRAARRVAAAADSRVTSPLVV